REWMREEASRVTDIRAGNISRQFNVPPSYVLIHRVSTAGIGVLCQLECEGGFRAEGLKWVPGYFDPPAGGPEDCGYSWPCGTSRPMARRCAACSLRITCMTALISARCVKACGKLPRCRPVRGSISSP